MASRTGETINGYGVKKIITTCPHGYNCLKNEYPQFGGNWEVYHHTEFLARLVRGGELAAGGALDQELAFHDSCYLGRYNGLYEEPRALLNAIPGLRLLEMERSRNKSFCCGAGGGRMWMEENLGVQKINEARTDQALARRSPAHRRRLPLLHHHVRGWPEGPGKDETVKVLDVAELLALSVDLKK